MKILKLVVFIFIFLISFIACENKSQNQDDFSDKIKYEESDLRKIKIISALQTLQKYRLGSDDNENSINLKKIKSITEEFENPDDIATFALMCRSMAYHCSDVECFKSRACYEPQFITSINRLSIKTANARKCSPASVSGNRS